MNSEDPESYITKNQFEKQNKIQMMNVVGDNLRYMSERQQQMNVVGDNLRYMSERQQQRAKNARKAFQAIGTPTTHDLKSMLNACWIKDCK